MIRAGEARVAPLRRQLEAARAEVEVLRTEERRRHRAEQLAQRRASRGAMAAGEVATLLEALEGLVGLDADFERLRFMRESATEVRLGYAGASRQSITFTDGAKTVDAGDMTEARRLWAEGLEPGSPAAAGVRIYPLGSRAERLVPPGEVRVETRSRD